MKNFIVLSLLCFGFLASNTYAADADVGKTKNSEIVSGDLSSFDYVVCQYNVVEFVNFEINTTDLANSPVNEFGILPEIYTGEKVWAYHSPVDYWILYKHLLDKPKTATNILAPRDKLSC